MPTAAAASDVPIKREISQADTELSVVGKRLAGPASPSSLPLPSASFRSDEDPNSEAYFRGAIHVVKWAAIGGGCLLLLYAVQMLFEPFIITGVCLLISAFVAAGCGFRGASKQDLKCLMCFAVIGVVLAFWFCVQSVIGLAVLFGVILPETDSNIRQRLGISRTRLICIHSVEVLVALGSTLFWTTAAYSTHRLLHIIKERQIEQGRRTRRRIMLESITHTGNSFYTRSNEEEQGTELQQATVIGLRV